MEHSIPPCFYRISIKALILNEEKKFLLSKEKNWIWDLPGGWLDEWEDISTCLKRELLEEMWLEIIQHESQPCYFLKFTGKSWKEKVNALYVTSVKDLNFIPSDECIEIGFYDIEEAKSLETYPNVQEFLSLYNPNNHGNR